MAVFAIIRPNEHQELVSRIQAAFPKNYRLTGGQWLVSANMTAREVSERIGLEKGSSFGSTLVLRISSYYGLHSTDTWDWLKTAMESSDG